MHASRGNCLHCLRKYLLILLLAFCWLLIQSQVAIASHHCDLSVDGEAVMLQHQQHQMAEATPVYNMMKGPLCEKHCVPDIMQKDPQHTPLIAIPATTTLAVVMPLCAETADSGWALSPPATGPPATIRFCRFRE